MTFETFEKQRQPPTTEPAVTLQKKGSFALNASAFDVLGKPEAVELLYDRDERLIGLRPALSENPNSYPVRPVKPGSRSYIVAGTAFAKHYGIELGHARRWIGRIRSGMLVLDMNEPIVARAGAKPDAETFERPPEHG